jgi:hypothetical protein
MYVDPSGLVFDEEIAKLRQAYARMVAENLNDDSIVAGLIREALILADGNAFKAFQILYELRQDATNDNDIWAAVEHFYQSWNLRYIVDNALAGLIADGANDFYSGLKLIPHSRNNLLPRDDPNTPPSPPTPLQYNWGKKGAWAATWFSNELSIGSPEWRKFLRWLDNQYSFGTRPPKWSWADFDWWPHGG